MIPLFSFLASYQANIISQTLANNDKKDKSMSIVDAVYDKIMYNQELYDVWTIIDDWWSLSNANKTRKFVDELEWLGNRYCQNQVYEKDLKVLTSFLAKSCKNNQIINNYKYLKNWFSKICLDIVWKDWMWSFYKDKKLCDILK